MPPGALMGQNKKAYPKNEKELGHSEYGCWRLLVVLYTAYALLLCYLLTGHLKRQDLIQAHVGAKTKPAVLPGLAALEPGLRTVPRLALRLEELTPG